MSIATVMARLKRSLNNSSGTIVFGMEDGTVSIFGLVFGVAATTTSNSAVLIAGASGAAAAAVSMMAGAYLDAETSRDETARSNACWTPTSQAIRPPSWQPCRSGCRPPGCHPGSPPH